MELILTQTIQEAITLVLKDPEFSTRQRKEAEQVTQIPLHENMSTTVGVSLALVLDVSSYLKSKPDKQDLPSIHELVKGSGVFIEPKKPVVKDPAFIAYMDQLRAEQQEREYAAMIASAYRPSVKDKYFQPDDIREAKSHIVTIINIGFSMVAVYVAVYMASRTMLEDIGLRVLLSLVGAFTIGIVETILYVKYTHLFVRSKKNKKVKKLN